MKKRLQESELSAERLREILHYDPQTGVFVWRVKPNRRTPAGACAGSIKSDGYVRIQVAGSSYYAHRLAWLYVNGSWPTVQIDHEHRIRHDNRIGWLREATRSQNCQNQTLSPNNKSGFKGVHLDRKSGKWLAKIRCKDSDSRSKTKYLGLYERPEDAAKAYAAGAAKYHTHNPAALAA